MTLNDVNQYYYPLLNDEVRDEMYEIGYLDDPVTDEDRQFHYYHKTNPFTKQPFWNGPYSRPNQIPIMTSYLKHLDPQAVLENRR